MPEDEKKGKAGAGDRKRHPSLSLEPRRHGYGIGGGYEKPYRRGQPPSRQPRRDSYGPVPHAGYYGSGWGPARFGMGQAGFTTELEWYRKQFGERTTSFEEKE